MKSRAFPLAGVYLSCIVFLILYGNRDVSASQAETARETPLSWPEIIDAVRSDASLRNAVDTLVRDARGDLSKGLVRRAHRLQDVGKHRTWLDGRSNVLEDEIRETFALAMSDFAACNALSVSLPRAAAAARITGDTEIRDHVVAQLREMSAWRPLQRPGWTLYAPGNRFPPGDKDGNWLATGCGIRAIVTALEIMGDDVSEALRQELADLMEGEIAGVVDDWEVRRPWFVKSDNAITNQWVLPTEGLVRACLYLGVDSHRTAYELGVKNLLQALSSHGPKGEFEEGIGYANFTVSSMLHAARAMAAAGDRRAADHPFLANFPVWSVLHIQPGRMTVNCFDAGGAQIPRDNTNWRSLLSLLVFTTSNEIANWALWEQFDGPSDDLMGLLCRITSRRAKRTQPDLYAAYERAPMVVWRDGWEDDASGVWIRGGHELDQHDHQDRGHVNLIFKGKAILIEAGTPSYSDPDMFLHWSPLGHNVLQTGASMPSRPYPMGPVSDPGWQRRGGIAPIDVHRLDDRGGSVTVDASDCYSSAETWLRAVKWAAGELTVQDEVELESGLEDVILFRWHLGTRNEVDVSASGRSIVVRWKDAVMRINGSVPLEVHQSRMPDATLPKSEDTLHTCIEVRSKEPLGALRLTTSVRPAR